MQPLLVKAICTAIFATMFSTLVIADNKLPVTTVQLIKETESWDGTPLPEYPIGQPEVTLQNYRTTWCGTTLACPSYN